MTMSRKTFLLQLSAGAWALTAAGCGGSDYEEAPAGDCAANIEANHGHSLIIAAADLDSAVARTYDITGTSGHAHSVTFSPAQFAQLKAGQTVNTISTVGAGHSHNITQRCA